MTLKLSADPKEREVSFSVPRSMYSRQAVEIAAHVFSKRVDVLLAEDKKAFDLTLRSKRKTADKAELEALGGEFVNELLNQEYRFIVSRFNQKISSLIVTQALLAARGGEDARPAGVPEAEKTPEFKAKVAALLREAEEEVKRTMPKKLPPQGNPLPPEADA